jgi:hypothetical protein
MSTKTASLSSLNQAVMVADHKLNIGKHTEANSLYAAFKKDAFTTNIGMIKIFNQRKLMNTPLLMMTDAQKNTMYVNGAEGNFRFSIPYDLELPMIVEDMTSGIQKVGIGNTKFKIKLNENCFTNTDIITYDYRDGIPLYITEDEIYQEGSGWVYTVVIPIRNRAELYFDRSKLQPGTQYMKITNVNGEFDTQKSSITGGTGSLALQVQLGGHRSVYHWITGYAHMLEVGNKEGSVGSSNYNMLAPYLDMTSDKATMNIFNIDKASGKAIPGSLSWIRYVDAKLMAELKQMEENDLWWNKGGLVQGSGKKAVSVNLGLHAQMKNGNYAQYSKLTLSFIESLLTRLYYESGIPFELRRAEFQVGSAAMIELSKLLADDFTKYNPFVVNADSLKNMIYGKDAMNLGYGFRFTSKRFPTAGEVSFVVNPAFDSRINRGQDGLFGEFPKLSHTIAIFDVTANAASNMAGTAKTEYRVEEGFDTTSNIVMIKPKNWAETTWGYEVGTIHPFGQSSSQGMYSNSQRHGFGMWGMSFSSIWMKDSSRSILIEKA